VKRVSSARLLVGSRKEFACKSILKRKLVTDDDVEDVRREQACAAASRPSGSVHLGRRGGRGAQGERGG